MNSKEIGLYIHIPFCLSKCFYCDFFSLDRISSEKKKTYLKALKKEIILYGKKMSQYRIKTIYIGGGTPTILEGIDLQDILYSCFSSFIVKKDAEITVECNPATMETEKARLLFQSGINRISLGAQSFKNVVLHQLGRIHKNKDILESFDMIRKSGFNNINIDLMFGLPGQRQKSLLSSLTKTVSLYPDHISLYALTIEAGTKYEQLVKNHLIKIPSDDIVSEEYNLAIHYLTQQGYEHYEISNFSLPGKRCEHNQIYWKNQSYLGLGASATSYIQKKRFTNYSNLDQYIHLLNHSILPVATIEVLPEKEEMSETIILHLRMMEGLSKSEFRKRFGKNVENVFPRELQYLLDNGLLSSSQSHYSLTKKGIFLANIAFMEFLK